jgi:hypothetical protein
MDNGLEDVTAAETPDDFRTTWIAGLLAGTLFTFCMYDSLSFNSSFIVLTKWNPQHVKK